MGIRRCTHAYCVHRHIRNPHVKARLAASISGLVSSSVWVIPEAQFRHSTFFQTVVHAARSVVVLGWFTTSKSLALIVLRFTAPLVNISVSQSF
jgi:hypothetical protein